MRYFLIDKVTELQIGERVRGIKNITLSDEILHDHFPDYPIMPGALILESIAQLGAFLLEMTFYRTDGPPLRAILIQVQKAKFHDSCSAGDQLDIEVAISSQIDAAARVTAEVRVREKRAVRAELDFAMKPIESERIHEQRRYLYKLWTRHLEQPLTLP